MVTISKDPALIKGIKILEDFALTLASNLEIKDIAHSVSIKHFTLGLVLCGWERHQGSGQGLYTEVCYNFETWFKISIAKQWNINII